MASRKATAFRWRAFIGVVLLVGGLGTVTVGGFIAFILLLRLRVFVNQGQALIVKGNGPVPDVYFTTGRVIPVKNRYEIMDISVRTIEISRHGKEGLW